MAYTPSSKSLEKENKLYRENVPERENKLYRENVPEREKTLESRVERSRV